MKRDGHAVEHDLDPRDVADAYFLIDGGEGRMAVCDTCGRAACACCRFCKEPRVPSCACDGDPISQRESRDMIRRADGVTWVKP